MQSHCLTPWLREWTHLARENRWYRLPLLQEASNRRAQYHRSGFWVNSIPTNSADRTRDWYWFYFGRRRNNTRTSGMLRHIHCWNITRYEYCKIGSNPRGIRANSWSRCSIISGRRTTGDHISVQGRYPWVNSMSAQIISIKIPNQTRLHPKYIRQALWNCKYPSGI